MHTEKRNVFASDVGTCGTPGCPCNTVPDVVREKIENSRLKFDAPIRYDHLLGCYYATTCGMFVGIELDGYIHS